MGFKSNALFCHIRNWRLLQVTLRSYVLQALETPKKNNKDKSKLKLIVIKGIINHNNNAKNKLTTGDKFEVTGTVINDCTCGIENNVGANRNQENEHLDVLLQVEEKKGAVSTRVLGETVGKDNSTLGES